LTSGADRSRRHFAGQNRNYTPRDKPWAHKKVYGIKRQYRTGWAM
jgi:hypothetical protein